MVKKRVINPSLMIGFIAILMLARPVYASTLDDLNQQKKDIQNSINANQQQIGNIQDIINSLDTQTAATQKEIDLTNQIIDLTNQQISQTQAEIAQKELELKQKKAALYDTIRTYYETGSPSTIEVVVGANNFSDIINASQYMQSLSDQINQEAQAIALAKSALETQENNLEKQKADLQGQKDSLVNQQRNLAIQTKQKSQLLSQANDKQYQLQGDLDNVSAAIYAARQKLGGFIAGGTGGYPWANANTNSIDRWGFYYRQCTSYAAWYFNTIEGKNWDSFRWLGVNRSSNGGDWADLGAYQGYSVSSTPRAGAIASWSAGGISGAYGHVAIVRSVNSNGTINVSEYNWVKFSYSERNNVSSSGAKFIY